MTGKISEMTPAGSAATTDLFEISRPGSPSTTLSVTGAQLRTMATAALPTSAPIQHPGYISGNWYVPFLCALAVTGSASTANSARFIPFIPESNVTVSQLGVRCTTLGSTNVQLAIYASDATTRKPTGTQLNSTANIADTATGFLSAALGANVSLTAGTLYWLAFNCGDSTAIFTAPASGAAVVSWVVGSATGNNAMAAPPLNSYSLALTLGTWGDLTAASFVEATDIKYAMVGFKVA